MQIAQSRRSWDTSIKHLARHGLLKDVLTPEQFSMIPRTNLSRWKNETEDKYLFSKINQITTQEIDLIKRLHQSSKIKTIVKSYFKLCDAFHNILPKIIGFKKAINQQKEVIINTIESVKEHIPIDNALKVFNISRATYQNYKTVVIHKCESSYFKWCTKRLPNQLLVSEVKTIKSYLTNNTYTSWSKSSIYLRAIKDGTLSCSLSTFYKYSSILGFSNCKIHRRYPNEPLVTTKPNEVWCADVTIFKTTNGVKHYIHILMDHYSKKILGYSIEKHNSGSTIRDLLKNAFSKYKPKNIMFLTDGGSENVNHKVASLINNYNHTIVHRIAQRDVLFSNSMIEAFNKVLKYQFLFPRHISSRNKLITTVKESIKIYNELRPQLNLGGNTPNEAFNGNHFNFNKYTQHFKPMQEERRSQNKNNACKVCS